MCVCGCTIITIKCIFSAFRAFSYIIAIFTDSCMSGYLARLAMLFSKWFVPSLVQNSCNYHLGAEQSLLFLLSGNCLT